jgi:hypothetical protein
MHFLALTEDRRILRKPPTGPRSQDIPQVGKAKQVMASLFDKLAAQTAQK